MGRKISNVIFELDRIYNTYAEQLLVSNAIAGMLHASVDIKASGNQVEGSIRNLLSTLLPRKVNVSHGHIVDEEMSVSRQQDILIVEGLETKSIIKTLDETEFFMFESVYAVGEVKRTFSIDSFTEALVSIKDSKTRLKRQKVPPNVFATSPDIIEAGSDLTNYGYRNPLLSFIFSIDFVSKLDIQSIKAVLSDRENWPYLPNFIIVLNQGVFFVMDESNTCSDHVAIKLYPEFEKDNQNCKWFFIQNPEEKRGRNIAFLNALLQQHIRDTLLFQPSMLQYASEIMKIDIMDLECMDLN